MGTDDRPVVSASGTATGWSCAWQTPLSSLARQLVGYGIASAAALATDMGCYAALVKIAGLGYVTAATISFLAGLIVVYLLSTRLAFKQHRLGNVKAEFLVFAAIGIVGLAINDAVIEVATAHAGFGYLGAKLLATGFTFLCNFLLRRQILFVKAKNLQGSHVATDQAR